MKGTVLSLYDFTGNMVQPWAEDGYTCVCVDIRHQGIVKKENVYYVGKDLMTWMPPLSTYKIVFAFPPCTHLAVSGARWFKKKGLDGLIEALQLFNRAIKIAQWSKAAYMIENPVSMISSYYRQPDYRFDPCDYAGYEGGEEDIYTKHTCLWTGGGFIMPEPKFKLAELGSKMHYVGPGEERGYIRSVTPKGFARAVFESNKGMQEIKI